MADIKRCAVEEAYDPAMTAEQNPTLCAAWLGYKYDPPTADIMIRICAWCPDKSRAETEARRLCLRVTHTVCERCMGEQMQLITESSPESTSPGRHASPGGI